MASCWSNYSVYHQCRKHLPGRHTSFDKKKNNNNWPTFSWLWSVPAPGEHPGFSVCLTTPVQGFRHVLQVVGSRDPQVVTLAMQQEEEENFSALGLERLLKRSVQKGAREWRWVTPPCRDSQCPLENWCEPVFENTGHIAGTGKIWSVARPLGPPQNLLQECRGFLSVQGMSATLSWWPTL